MSFRFAADALSTFRLRRGVWLAALVVGACEPDLLVSVTTTADGGPGSLRDAVDQTNATGGPSATIELPPGTYTLTRCGIDDDNTTGDLDITSKVPVLIKAIGNGVVVRQTCAGDRVLDDFGGSLTLDGVTITGGSLTGTADAPNVNGGGLRTVGDLVLTNTTITGNSAHGAAVAGNGASASGSARGGGVFVGGSLSANGAVLSSNDAIGGDGIDSSSGVVATAGGAGEGGGVYVLLNVSWSGGSISGNRAIGGVGGRDQSAPGGGGDGRGGGLARAEPAADDATSRAFFMDTVSLSNNSARGGDAGALLGDSALPSEQSPLARAGNADGGAIGIVGIVNFSFTNVTASANQAIAGSAGLVAGRCAASGVVPCRSFAVAGAARGGAVALSGNPYPYSSYFTLNQSSFSKNQVTSGDTFSACFGTPCSFVGSPPAAAAGGGFYAFIAGEMNSGTFAENSATQGAGKPILDGAAEGGGIASGGLQTTNGSFTGNVVSGGHGGALSSGNCNLKGTTFTNNRADGRGGAVACNSATLDHVVATGNQAGGSGGGAVAAQTASIEYSQFNDNSVDSEQTPETAVFAGGAGVLVSSDVTMSWSQFLRNTGRARLLTGNSSVATAFFGGGLAAETASLNSVTSGYNRVEGASSSDVTSAAQPGISGGAGLGIRGKAHIVNTTISANTVASDGSSGPPRGAGILAQELVLEYLTLADNSGAATLDADKVSSRVTVAIAPDGQSVCAPTVSIGGSFYNYFNDVSCHLQGQGDRQGAAQFLLSPLGNYGGYVQTQPPALGSVLIDAAQCPNTFCTYNCVCVTPFDETCMAPSYDARLVSRPQNRTCDIGAVELRLTTL